MKTSVLARANGRMHGLVRMERMKENSVTWK